MEPLHQGSSALHTYPPLRNLNAVLWLIDIKFSRFQCSCVLSGSCNQCTSKHSQSETQKKGCIISRYRCRCRMGFRLIVYPSSSCSSCSSSSLEPESSPVSASLYPTYIPLASGNADRIAATTQAGMILLTLWPSLLWTHHVNCLYAARRNVLPKT